MISLSVSWTCTTNSSTHVSCRSLPFHECIYICIYLFNRVHMMHALYIMDLRNVEAGVPTCGVAPTASTRYPSSHPPFFAISPTKKASQSKSVSHQVKLLLSASSTSFPIRPRRTKHINSSLPSDLPLSSLVPLPCPSCRMLGDPGTSSLIKFLADYPPSYRPSS